VVALPNVACGWHIPRFNFQIGDVQEIFDDRSGWHRDGADRGKYLACLKDVVGSTFPLITILTDKFLFSRGDLLTLLMYLNDMRTCNSKAVHITYCSKLRLLASSRLPHTVLSQCDLCFGHAAFWHSREQ
jgi:hypothetical protein